MTFCTKTAGDRGSTLVMALYYKLEGPGGVIGIFH